VSLQTIAENVHGRCRRDMAR